MRPSFMPEIELGGAAKDFSYFKSVHRYDRWIAMKPQFGVCKNKVGCSLAYTGEKIPLPPDSKCPECGQPLALDSSKQSSAKILVAFGLVLLLILIGGAVALFAFKDQIFHLAINKQETGPKVVEAQGEDKLASSSPAQGQESSLPPANASTPDSQTSSEDKAAIAPTETPTPLPSPTADQDKRKVVTETTPPRTDSDASTATGAEIQPPATLTKSQVDATREDVLKRINAMPKFTAEEKKRLGRKNADCAFDGEAVGGSI